MPKVLITGAAGQLGRALAASTPVGYHAILATRDMIDLADPAAVHDVVRAVAPDVLINAAAYTAVDRAESEEDLAKVINADSVRAMSEALSGAGGRLIQVSSDFVFDGASSRAYRPDDPKNPLSAYGRTKAAGEDSAGAAAIVVRTAWVHGGDGSNFVNTMLRLMRERDVIRVVADQIGAPTWTGGLASAIWGLAAQDRPGIWHWTDSGVASWYDFALAIQEEAFAAGLLERKVPVLPIATADYPTPARRPNFSLLDSSATREALGVPPVHWRVNLRKMLEEKVAA